MHVDRSVAIKQHIESAQTKALKVVGRQRQEAERRAVQEAMADLDALRLVYHEALVEQSHSVMVKKITEDLAGLASMLRGFGTELPSEEQGAQVRNRIQSWNYDSRRWIGDLPHQSCLIRLPKAEGCEARDRTAEVRRLWLEAGGALFNPSPLNLRAPRPSMPPRWVLRPASMIELLALAQEALEAEIGGRNLGGHAPFAQRRRRTSLKDAFAFACLRIYEQAVGPKTARQGDARRRDLNTHSFDHFVAMVHRWVAGPGAPHEWEPGIEPIRKAIATQRAWQKLLKVAGCADEDAFNALPLIAQVAAARKLPDKVRRRLTPAAPPLI
jgi:hypothetical protein